MDDIGALATELGNVRGMLGELAGIMHRVAPSEMETALDGARVSLAELERAGATLGGLEATPERVAQARWRVRFLERVIAPFG